MIKEYTPKQALNRLKKFTKFRNYRIEGEQICPAEDWLIRQILPFANRKIHRHDSQRGYKRKMLYLAKTLGLHPIPEWWTVRERIQGNTPMELGKSFHQSILDQDMADAIGYSLRGTLVKSYGKIVAGSET